MRRPAAWLGRSVSMAVAVAILAGLALALPAVVTAHPLGNFSINHLVEVRVSTGRLNLSYILDQAEIPTFQERGIPDAQILARKQAEVARALGVTLDGRPLALTEQPGALISHPPGQGGLPLTRVALSLTAPLPARGQLAINDQSFPDHVGWKAIEAKPGSGTSVHSTAPSTDPTNELRSYPTDMLKSPLDQRTASFTLAPGDGTLTAPRGLGDAQATTTNRSGDGFAGVFASAANGKGVLLFLLLAAFGWGAVHALSPGHGKAMVAAYLVGSRGTPRHALALGLTVTATHTVGVFTLGGVTLLLSQYILPEQLYPWLNLVSGLLVVAIGLGVLRSRLRWRRRVPVTDHPHPVMTSDAQAAAGDRSDARVPVAALVLEAEGEDEHAHRQAHGDHSHDHHHSHDIHSHDHDHPHDVHSPDHDHHHGPGGHSHELPDRITPRALLAMGASAGLIPCPSALVVLLGAVAQHQVGLGLALIVAFSLGLATTLSGLGFLVVSARRVTARANFTSPFMTALPAISALVIVGAGCLLTAQALPQLV